MVSRAAERSGECASKKRNHAPCGCAHMHMHMHTLTHVRAGERAHTRTQMCVPESAHTCMCTYCTRRVHEIHAPEGCTKNITARSNLRTHVIVSKSCERRARHACAHLRCPRVHARVYTCAPKAHVIHAPFGCMYPHRRCGLRAAERSGECATKKKKQTEP